MVKCPLCQAAIDVDEDELDEGDEFNCDDCGAALGVTSADPLEIEPQSDADEDEEEDEDDADDDDDEDADEEEDEEEEDWK